MLTISCVECRRLQIETDWWPTFFHTLSSNFLKFWNYGSQKTGVWNLWSPSEAVLCGLKSLTRVLCVLCSPTLGLCREHWMKSTNTAAWFGANPNTVNPVYGYRERTTLPLSGATKNVQHCPWVGPHRTHSTALQWGYRERSVVPRRAKENAQDCLTVGLQRRHSTAP